MREGTPCMVPLCAEHATHAHPVVHSFGVCAKHHRKALSIIDESESGQCKIAHFQRERSGLPEPPPSDIFCCNGHGCLGGYHRPCFVCGEKDTEDGNELQPCYRAGCTAWAHEACRDVLSRRLEYYWDEDDKWYPGFAATAERVDDVEVQYDDGTVQTEDLASGDGVRWLIPADCQPCVCVRGAAVDHSEIEDGLRTCAVCFAHDVRQGSEPGNTNHIIFCEACGVSVHLWCYGQTAEGDLFGSKSVDSIRFICDHCRHLDRGNAPAECKLCPHKGGLIRPLKGGGWAHPACVSYNIRTTVKPAPKHRAESFCSRQSGCQICFKNGFALEAAKESGRPECSVASCPCKRSARDGLIRCGGCGVGCMKYAHVTCAQQPNSGWHLKQYETETSSTVEALCSYCDDAFLDMRALNGRPKYAMQCQFKQPVDATSYISTEAYDAAEFTFQDWCHGVGGMRRAAERCGGVCTGACDIAHNMRMTYLATFDNATETVHNLSRMGSDARVARPSDVIFCGFCCKPFSPAGNTEGFAHETFGNNFELMVQSLKERRTRGVFDPCIICENVPNLLSFLKAEHLQRLGYHCKIYIVYGPYFRCANVRKRLVLIGFLDRAHLDAFTPPPPQTATPKPLFSVLKGHTVESSRELFIRRPQLQTADNRCHVVGRSYPMGALSPTSAYSVNTPGSLILVGPLTGPGAKYSALETPLPPSQVRKLNFGEVRKMHPDEILASLSFKPHEMPRLVGALDLQYQLVCQTVCVNVFEAFTAEALAAMGKPGPRERLRRSLNLGDEGLPGDEGDWLVTKRSGWDVPYFEYSVADFGQAEQGGLHEEAEDRLLLCYNGEGS